MNHKNQIWTRQEIYLLIKIWFVRQVINIEVSETSKGDSEKEKCRNFLHARAVHVLNVYRINLVLQTERLSVI